MRHHLARKKVLDGDTNCFALVCGMARSLASGDDTGNTGELTRMKTNYTAAVAVSGALAMLLAGQAAAGDFQLGVRAGKTWIHIDADRLSSGNTVSESLINLGVTASYRWDNGGYLEAGIGG